MADVAVATAQVTEKMAEATGANLPDPEKSPRCYYKDTRKGQALRGQSQQVSLNVYSCIREEHPNLTVKECMEEASRLTSVSSRAIFSAKKRWRTSGGVLETPGKKRSRRSGAKRRDVKCDNFCLCAIRGIVHGYFFRNEPPTLKKILSDVNSNPDLPFISRATLHRAFEPMGFHYIYRGYNSCLTDKPEIIACRHRYLRRLRQYRSEGRKIYFLGETCVNAGYAISQCWKEQNIKLICSHCGSEEGFVDDALLLFQAKSTGGYHDEMNGDYIEEWFSKLLPKLHPGSVIVMHNTSYYTLRSDTIPTEKSSKEDIRTWLTEKGISWESNQIKPELLILVQQEKHKFTQFRIDKQAFDAGHQVLHLPPYHTELNPIELAWSHIKGRVVEQTTTDKLMDVMSLFEEGVREVTPEMWRGFIHQVMEKEQQFWDLDLLQENTETSSLKITLGSDSDSASSSSKEL